MSFGGSHTRMDASTHPAVVRATPPQPTGPAVSIAHNTNTKPPNPKPLRVKASHPPQRSAAVAQRWIRATVPVCLRSSRHPLNPFLYVSSPVLAAIFWLNGGSDVLYSHPRGLILLELPQLRVSIPLFITLSLQLLLSCARATAYTISPRPTLDTLAQ